MKSNLKAASLVMIFFASLNICSGADSEGGLKEVIASLNKLQSKHLSLLVGHAGSRMLNEGDKRFSESWCNDIRKLTTNLVKGLEVGKDVFDYPGLLGCGRIITKKDGYMIEMYSRTRSIGDTARSSIVRHIVYLSNKGKILNIGRSMPFSD